MKLPSSITIANCGFQIMMFGARKEGLTPEEFRDYYENVHIPFMLNLTGETFPLTHERHYVKRGGPPKFSAQLLEGTQEDFNYDAVAILTYRDRAHFEANWAFFENPDTAKLIKANEDTFSAWTTGVYIDTVTTVTTGSRA